MTTIVPTSEEDPALSVVRYTAEISWADAGPEVLFPHVFMCVIRGTQFKILPFGFLSVISDYRLQSSEELLILHLFLERTAVIVIDHHASSDFVLDGSHSWLPA